MGQTPKKHHDGRRNARGAAKRDTPTHTLARVERDLKAYELALQGCSVRGVCQELGIKSTQTAHRCIERGKAFVLEKGIDVDERRIEIDRMFKETLGHLAQTVRHQAEHGCETFFVDSEGNKSLKRIKGVDPRIAGELSRSLHRWSEFLGLMERAPEQNVQATTVVLSAPAAGADFESRYGDKQLAPGADQQTIDTAAVPVKDTVISEGGPGWGAPPSDQEAAA